MLRSLIEDFSSVRDAWREGERRLATQNASPPAQDAGPGDGVRDAGTTTLSVFD